MKEITIQYHPSYSSEENVIVHDFIETSTEKELVDAIRELQKIYAEHIPNINETFKQLEREIQERDVLDHKHEILVKCKNEWSKYYTELNNYRDASIIRKAYVTFKKEYKGKKVYENFFQQYFETENMPFCNSDFFRKATISEGRKSCIGKPKQPDIYYSVEEIEAPLKNGDVSLESIGKNNLKYLLTIMLSRIDTPKANEIPVTIAFLTRKYAEGSHKKKECTPLFASTLLSSSDLIKDNQRLLKEIKYIEQECKDILAEIDNDK